MTSLAAALGMMPLAWAFGSGADMLRPLVIAVIGGLYEQQQIAFRDLTVILIAAILLVFLLLLFLYENFRVAFAMLLVPLFGVAGVFFGLWVTGTEFNITSRMGMTMVSVSSLRLRFFITRNFARCLPAMIA